MRHVQRQRACHPWVGWASGDFMPHLRGSHPGESLNRCGACEGKGRCRHIDGVHDICQRCWGEGETRRGRKTESPHEYDAERCCWHAWALADVGEVCDRCGATCVRDEKGIIVEYDRPAMRG